MQFSLSFAAFIALSGQTLAQSATGSYVITESDNILTAKGTSPAVFSPFNGSYDQIWSFNGVGFGTVVIQCQDSPDYLNCDEDGSPCTPSTEPQIFEPIKRGQELYQISDDSGDLFLAESSDKTIHLVYDVQDDEKALFTLTRPAECEYYSIHA
ncbi:hypothetical protein NYO67_11428 [Aspergillus flavus]|nr:hypothetical protein NYO67_11428 [Aspergillus flavus]